MSMSTMQIIYVVVGLIVGGAVYEIRRPKLKKDEASEEAIMCTVFGIMWPAMAIFYTVAMTLVLLSFVGRLPVVLVRAYLERRRIARARVVNR